MDLQFGLGKNKQTPDLYPETPMIILPSLEKEEITGVTKVTLNKKAYEILELFINEDNEIAFSTSKSDTKKTFLINANNYDSKANIKLKKNGTYSNKNNFTVLKERFNTKLEKELLLEIVLTDRKYNDLTIFELVKFTTEKDSEKSAEKTDLQHEQDKV